jgi:hypothetical protein
MSLYRQASGSNARLVVAFAVVALAAGGIAGFAIGRSTAEEPTLAELVGDLQEELRPAEAALELVPLEYGQAAGGSGGETEYAAALAQAETAVSTVAAAREDLAAISPERADETLNAVEAVHAAVEDRAPVPTVERAAREASAALNAATG